MARGAGEIVQQKRKHRDYYFFNVRIMKSSPCSSSQDFLLLYFWGAFIILLEGVQHFKHNHLLVKKKKDAFSNTRCLKPSKSMGQRIIHSGLFRYSGIFKKAGIQRAESPETCVAGLGWSSAALNTTQLALHTAMQKAASICTYFPTTINKER